MNVIELEGYSKTINIRGTKEEIIRSFLYIYILLYRQNNKNYNKIKISLRDYHHYRGELVHLRIHFLLL